MQNVDLLVLKLGRVHVVLDISALVAVSATLVIDVVSFIFIRPVQLEGLFGFSV